MYIKHYHKDNKDYYVLCCCDVKTNVWCERFINEKIFNVLKELVKVIDAGK